MIFEFFSKSLKCFIFSILQIFHVDCFCCVVCEKQLHSGEQFGLANGKLYCKTDFEALPNEAIDTAAEGIAFISLIVKDKENRMRGRVLYG